MAMRILCVDDDRLVLGLTAELLRGMGHEVVEARSARSATEALNLPSPIDLLITDIHMPGGLSGIELAEHARRIRPELRIVYFSGSVLDMPPGSEGTLLRKPCTLRELQRVVGGGSTA
jgi:CheY-like chemotaxis protein